MIWSMLSKLSVCFKTKFKFNSFNRNRNISNKVLYVIFGNNPVKNMNYHLLRMLLLISYFSYQAGIHVFRYTYQFQFHNALTVGYWDISYQYLQYPSLQILWAQYFLQKLCENMYCYSDQLIPQMIYSASSACHQQLWDAILEPDLSAYHQYLNN